MRYSEITKTLVKEDATAGATASASVASVAAPFMSYQPEKKTKAKKPVVLKRNIK